MIDVIFLNRKIWGRCHYSVRPISKSKLSILCIHLSLEVYNDMKVKFYITYLQNKRFTKFLKLINSVITILFDMPGDILHKIHPSLSDIFLCMFMSFIKW